jgi:predicted nucleotidyltransferase
MTGSTPAETTHADFLEATRNRRGLWRVRLVDGDRTLSDIDDVLFVTPTGSHLFGTADAESDFDVTGIFVEPLEAIILGEDRHTIRASSSEGAQAPNRPGDFDAEFVELRRFVEDALAGQPYALELLHAPEAQWLLSTEPFEQLVARRRRFLSRRIEPFAGYCRSQAEKYGDKGRRLEAIERSLEVLEAADRGEPIRRVVDRLPFESEFVERVEQPIRGQDEPVELVAIAGKKFELEAKIAKALDSLTGLRDEYGARAERARRGTDWKAISHAYRIAWELRELLADQQLTFPRPRADFLSRIKRGEVAAERVERQLPEVIDDALSTPTDLPEQPETDFWESWLIETYKEAFCPA